MWIRWKSAQHKLKPAWQNNSVSVQQGATDRIQRNTVGTKQEITEQPQEEADQNQEGKSKTHG